MQHRKTYQIISTLFDLASPIPWMLFLLIFASWTPPHFWALALYRSGEYRKVGVPMMPDVKGAKRTLKESKAYCILLFLIGISTMFLAGRSMFAVGFGLSFLDSILTLWYSISVWRIDPDEELDANGRMPKCSPMKLISIVNIIIPAIWKFSCSIHTQPVHASTSSWLNSQYWSCSTWMFIAFVYITAVPSDYVWEYSIGFLIIVPIVNLFAIKMEEFKFQAKGIECRVMACEGDSRINLRGKTHRISNPTQWPGDTWNRKISKSS